MKSIEFQLQNGIIYPGYSDGNSFLGDDMIYITNDIRRRILHDVTKGIGVRPISNVQTVAKKLSSARVGNDGYIAIWGIPAVILKDLEIIEYSRTIEPSDEENYKDIKLNGHYFDIVRHTPGDMAVGEKRGMDGGVVMTYWGQHESLTSALARLTELGASARSSVLATEPDPDVASDRVITRRYKSPHRRVSNLCEFVSEVPLDVIKADEDYAERWARQMLSEAQQSDPDVDWYMGITPLMLEVERCRSAMTQDAE